MTLSFLTWQEFDHGVCMYWLLSDANGDKDIGRVLESRRILIETCSCWLTSLTCREGPQEKGMVNSSRDWILAGLGLAFGLFEWWNGEIMYKSQGSVLNLGKQRYSQVPASVFSMKLWKSLQAEIKCEIEHFQLLGGRKVLKQNSCLLKWEICLSSLQLPSCFQAHKMHVLGIE